MTIFIVSITCLKLLKGDEHIDLSSANLWHDPWSTFMWLVVPCFKTKAMVTIVYKNRLTCQYMYLTGGNWQKWKRVFLTCPCHKIYRDEAVGLKSCKNTWKITIFVKMWNLGQYHENWYFVNNNTYILPLQPTYLLPPQIKNIAKYIWLCPPPLLCLLHINVTFTQSPTTPHWPCKVHTHTHQPIPIPQYLFTTNTSATTTHTQPHPHTTTHTPTHTPQHIPLSPPTHTYIHTLPQTP